MTRSGKTKLLNIIRLFVAMFLGFVFIGLTLFFAVVFRVNDTLLEPDFYIDQLQKGDVYNFFYEEAAPASLEEIDERAEDLPVVLSSMEEDIVGPVRAAFPPEWLQEQAEVIIDSILPYITGDQDTFEVTLVLADRVEAAGEGIKKAVSEGNVLDVLYDETLVPRVTEALGDSLQDLPFGISLTEEDVQSAVSDVVEREWLRAQVTHAVDEVVPYFTGQRDQFSVRIDLPSRAESASRVLKDILEKGDIAQFLFDEMMDPVVEDAVGPLVELPYGLSITNQEIQAALREVLPKSWIDERVSDTVDQAVAYLTDKDRPLTVAVPLGDRKAAAVEVVGDLADRKLEQLYSSSPVCTPQQVAGLDFGALAEEGIPCRVPGLDVTQFQQRVGVLVGAQAEETIDRRLPDSWVFTEADLRERMDLNKFDALQDLRRWLSDGYVFTSDDLRETLAKTDFDGGDEAWDAMSPGERGLFISNSDAVENLGKVRGWIRDGFSFDESDLEKRIREEAGDSGGEVFANFNSARSWLGRARSLQWVGWVFFVGFLAVIGLLGGRSVAGKVIWAAAFLGIAGAILFLGSGPVYESVIQDQLQESIDDEVAERDGLEAVMLEKVGEVAINASGEFNSGLKNQGLLYLIAALALVGAALAWGPVRRSIGGGGGIDKPIAVIKGPIAESEEPAAEPEKPVVVIAEPVAESEEPAAEPEKPVVVIAEPVAESEEPAAEPEEPVAESEEPAAEPEEPVAESEEPAAEPEEPVADSEEPAAEPEEPTGETKEI